jgi:hypothetical protein
MRYRISIGMHVFFPPTGKKHAKNCCHMNRVIVRRLCLAEPTGTSGLHEPPKRCPQGRKGPTTTAPNLKSEFTVSLVARGEEARATPRHCLQGGDSTRGHSHYPLHTGISPSPAVDSNVHRTHCKESTFASTINKKQAEDVVDGNGRLGGEDSTHRCLASCQAATTTIVPAADAARWHHVALHRRS